MNLLKPYIPLFFGILFVAFLGLAASVPNPFDYSRSTPPQISETVASSTVPEVITLPTSSTTETGPLAIVETPPEEQKPAQNSPITPAKEVPVKQEVVVVPVVQQTPPAESVETLNDAARAALVNVFCLSKAGSALPSFSGSGLIIDPRGIVITNAHVAEHMLLKDYQMPDALQCVLRTGAPARNTYTIELMYLPPSWVYTNAAQITAPNPTGTGEDDYAFLRITGTTNGTALPETFPALPIETTEANIHTGDNVLVAAYPAGFLGDQNIETALYPITNLSSVGTLYTFEKETLDLVSLGNIAVSQKGSSGGGALNALGKVIALIVTTSDGATTAERDLRAITFAHVSRSLVKNAGYTLQDFLQKDPASAAHDFQTNVAPTLTAQLTTEYDKR